MPHSADSPQEFLRHTVATVAYRGAKVLRTAPPGFAAFQVSPGTRTPLEIVAHLADLFAWATQLAEGLQVWKPVTPEHWHAEVDRFFEELGRFDARLASNRALGCEAGQLFQGPIADALTHVGQLALLRRSAGSPVRGENYFRADIRPGVVGPEQAPSRVEFD